MDLLARIHASRKEFVADIREYARSQKEDWSRVPWLALQADGRNGYLQKYQYAYRHGLWPVHCSGASPVIDCATGELIGWNRKPLCDGGVFELGNSLDELDASKIVRDLQREAANEIPSRDTQEKFDQRARWRERLIEELSLSRSYVRRPGAATAA